MAKKKLTKEERNLLSVAYKNVVGSRRASWRVLHSIEEQNDPETRSKKHLTVKYRQQVEQELEEICGEVLQLLDETLCVAPEIPDEAQVFYYKMKGDYLRYLAEVQTLEKHDKSAKDARTAYEAAQKASASLKATNPIRLGLALNFSVFYYEILGEQALACNLAKDAFDVAVGELDELDGGQYKDATLIMQLLRDNLTLWQAEGEADAAPDNRESNVAQDGTEVEDL